MLIVLGKIKVNPDHVAGARQAITTMEVETLKESGCDSYAFSLSISDPGEILITERWRSMEDLEAHFKTPHMAAFNAALGSVEIVELEVKAYDVAGEVPLPSM
jgi:quinol monooxygenase YgiN